MEGCLDLIFGFGLGCFGGVGGFPLCLWVFGGNFGFGVFWRVDII